jgi:hypothetical protein
MTVKVAKVARLASPAGRLASFVTDAPSTASGCADVLYQSNGQPCPQYADFLARRGATKTTYSGSRYNDERYDRIGSFPGKAAGQPARPGTGRSGNGGAPEAHYGGAISRVVANALRPAARPPLTATVAAHIQAAFDAAFNAPPVDLGILTGDTPADDPHTPTTTQTGPGLPAPLNIWVDGACATGAQWTTIDGITHTKTGQVLECSGPIPDVGRSAGTDADHVDLYHGTTVAGAANIRRYGIDFAHSRAARDFGTGFYTTLDYAQAARWAGRGSDGRGAVLHYRVPRSAIAGLAGLSFDGPTQQFLDLVRAMRSGGAPPGYEYAEGPC